MAFTTIFEFIEEISSEYEENPNYENVRTTVGLDGFTIDYNLKEIPNPDPVIVAQVRAIVGQYCKIPALTSRHQKEFFPYPEFN